MNGFDLLAPEMPPDPRRRWVLLGQAERDAAYDNNAAVKNSAELIAERNEASAALRASRKSSLDVPYGDRERTKIDLYPAADKAAPCLVFLHGGSFTSGSANQYDSHRLAANGDLVVVTVDYRLGVFDFHGEWLDWGR